MRLNPSFFFLLFLFFFHPIYYPRTTVVLPPSSNPDPWSHSGPSSPLPTTVRSFILIARRIQHFLPSSTPRRTVPTHAARRSQQLILFFFFANLVKISSRWDSNSRTNASSIRLTTRPPGRPATLSCFSTVWHRYIRPPLTGCTTCRIYLIN